MLLKYIINQLKTRKEDKYKTNIYIFNNTYHNSFYMVFIFFKVKVIGNTKNMIWVDNNTTGLK